MAKIRITGYSDDNVEVEGDIREEWSWYPAEGERRLIAVSDGTLLEVEYDQDGIWRFRPVMKGSADYSKVEGSVSEDTFDVVTLEGAIEWVAMATVYARRK